jgi:hypothetical protein
MALTTGVSVVARDALQPVAEWTTNGAHTAPVDFGMGIRRGRPKSYFLVADHKVRSNAIADPTPQGTVTGITIVNGGGYVSYPSCAIGAPTLTGGTQATCSAFGFGVVMWRLPTSTAGSGYSVNDLLTMNAMPGLNCVTYPVIRVTGISATGGITELATYNWGFCTSFPTTGIYTFNGGTGAGYTTPTGTNGIRWQILYAAVAGGAGYVTPPPVTFQSSVYGTATGVGVVTPMITATSAWPGNPVPAGGPTAGVQGVFGASVSWPINAVHLALLPDGRVLNYGTDLTGRQGAQLFYDIWDPNLGTAQNSHLVLPNSTSTDIFCSGTSVLWRSGEVLLTGGDLTINGQRNYANNKTTIFNPATNGLSDGSQMQFPRWYASLVPLPNGQKLAIGGSTTLTPTPTTPVQKALTPELFDPTNGWTTLTGATQPGTAEWYYPRVFAAPAGNLIEVTSFYGIYSLGTSGLGSLQHYNISLPAGGGNLPTVMYAPGKILSVRLQSVLLIDINGSTPAVTTTAPLDQLRYDAAGTVLADGTVLVTGGSSIANQLSGAAYTTQLWSPATGRWTTGATATKPRLYHGNALLLPDGSVLTAGGGSPGPVVNLNAEIYYPPYLYVNDGSGNPAPRPIIVSTPTQSGVGQSLSFTMGDGNPLSRVTLVRAGAATHSTNIEQRFLDLTATMVQSGQQVSVALPSNPNIAMPGYWLVFAFNQAGVPSVAQQVLITH